MIIVPEAIWPRARHGRRLWLHYRWNQVNDLNVHCAEVEGRVRHNLTARPQTVDSDSLTALAKITAEAATERHVTEQDTNVVFQRQGALNAKTVVTRVAKRKTISNEDFQARRDELEGKMFELFHEAPNWKTQDIAVRPTAPSLQVYADRRV
jgi:predicted molibdopterin-dependent oxidoreductase YjgC